MGAWIEIVKEPVQMFGMGSRPRMGAWIEIDGDYGTTEDNDVAPVWGRGLKLDTL